MRWRNTLGHESGTVVASEFEGLKAAIIGLTRHSDFHTLVKEFKSSFRAYGSNGAQDGRRDWIKNIESTFGPDSVIAVLIEYAPDNYTFQTLYEGEIGIQTIVEGLEFDHYLEFTPVQTGYWRKFISRYDVPVNIQSDTNLDGIAVTVYSPEKLTMPTQVINYSGEYREKLSLKYITSIVLDGYLLDWSTVILDDIKKYNLLKSSFELIPTYDTQIGLIPVNGDGLVNIKIKLISSGLGLITSTTPVTYEWRALPGNFELRIRRTNSSSYVTGTESVITVGGNSYLVTEFDGDIQANSGEQIAIYGVGGGVSGTFRVFFGETRLNYLSDVDFITTIQIVLSGEQVIDGVLTSSSRVLVKDQSDKEENGVYVSNSGAWVRSSDCDSPDELLNATVFIVDVYPNGTFWRQTKVINNLGLDPIEWIIYNATTNPQDNKTQAGEYNIPYDGPVVENYLKVTQYTTFPDSDAQAFLQHDIAASILDRITEPDKFYSELMGSPYTQARTYVASGDWWNNVLIKLIHARGYTLSEKLFSLSMKDFWEGANPMFNLSLGYEAIDGVERIVIRTKAEAYDASSMSVLLSGVQRIKRKYSSDYFNGAKMGAFTGKTEDISGIDDPQSRTAASILKNIGRVFTNMTSWIFQSLTIEQARRTTKIKSADYKYDDNIAVVEVTQTGNNTYRPRLNEDFSSVTNLLNEETRYNKHHTPARFLIRWADYLSGGLQKYIGTVFRFTGGEGNYDMISEMVPGSAPDDYNGDPLAENANIPVGTTYLWIPKVFEIDHYLTFEEFQIIDANRNLAIGLSQTHEDHAPFFIDDLQLELMTGQLKLIGKFKNEFDIITVPPGSQIFQGGKIFDSTFDFSFE